MIWRRSRRNWRQCLVCLFRFKIWGWFFECQTYRNSLSRHESSKQNWGCQKKSTCPVQYTLTNQSLLDAFPFKQRSTPQLHINQSYIFNELDKINTLRNRIAHHEPLCFPTGQAVVDTAYIRREYQKILTLFQWMGIDGRSMLYGLDHVLKVCDKFAWR